MGDTLGLAVAVCAAAAGFVAKYASRIRATDEGERKIVSVPITPTWDDAVEGLRGQEDRLVAEIARSVRDEVAELGHISDERLLRLVEFDFRASLDAMSEQRHPAAPDLDAAAGEVAALAGAGVSLDAVLQASRVVLRRVWELARDRARELGVSSSVQLEKVDALWVWADAAMARHAAAHRGVELEPAGPRESQRAGFVRGLLEGELAPAEAESRAAAYGLLPGGSYIAVRARPPAGGDARRLARSIEATGGIDGRGAIAVVVDGEVWGVTHRAPRVDGPGLVAMGGTTRFAALPASFRLAARALETAVAFGMSGAVGIDDLALRAAVLSEEELGERLVRRYLDPLRALGAFGDTLERTVERYLRDGMRIDESARGLFIHPNTMRHRVDRFQQLSGADLHNTEDVVGVWWALQRRRLRLAPGEGAGEEH
jgi:PucR C-terminal helix-turn-helix domain